MEVELRIVTTTSMNDEEYKTQTDKQVKESKVSGKIFGSTTTTSILSEIEISPYAE